MFALRLWNEQLPIDQQEFDQTFQHLGIKAVAQRRPLNTGISQGLLCLPMFRKNRIR